ncbi:MAG: hypothetical protein B6U95_02365 [Thermofilum sp. ex4484_82]|nr:MAG: hypothetical protein B6U95_02365 [Thermofilum sp. ex4484_82]OYT39300.1 MAG: hypothetical protein B6U96_02365 [Archaeoglobales archaeon ex4484_92]
MCGKEILALFGRALERFEKELEILKRLKHPNIISLLENPTRSPLIVLEYCENGSLRNILKNAGKLYVKLSLEITKPIVDTATYVHKHNVIREALNQKNILFTKLISKQI